MKKPLHPLSPNLFVVTVIMKTALKSFPILQDFPFFRFMTEIMYSQKVNF